MIFRRRRTRIEIEHTTVKVKAGVPNSAAPRTAVVPPTSASPVESVLARLLAFPAAGPNETHAQPSVTAIDATTAKETRP